MTWDDIKEHLDAGRSARRGSWMTSLRVRKSGDGALVYSTGRPVSARMRRWFEAAKDWEVCT